MTVAPVLAVLAFAVAACGGNGASVSTTSTPGVSSTRGATSVTSSTSSTTIAPTSIPSTTSSFPTTSTTFEGVLVEVTVEEGEVMGDRRVPIELGQEVRLVVVADVTDEVHVHGFDLLAEVSPGDPAELEFVADIPGVFEVELETAGMNLVDMEISP